MSILGKTPANFDEAVRLLAQSHKQEEPAIQAIYWFPDPRRQEVRFIEVNPRTIPSGEAMVFSFAAVADFPYRSSVGEVTPEEWGAILRGEIPLPEGWDLKMARPIEVQAA